MMTKPNVRFGSEADICAATRDVRFAANSDRKSRHAANGHVRFTPESGRVGANRHICPAGKKGPLRAALFVSRNAVSYR